MAYEVTITYHGDSMDAVDFTVKHQGLYLHEALTNALLSANRTAAPDEVLANVVASVIEQGTVAGQTFAGQSALVDAFHRAASELGLAWLRHRSEVGSRSNQR